MATHTLRLDGWWPTPLNVLMRQHWAKRNKALKADAEVVGGEAMRQGIPRATGKRRVSLLIRFNHASHVIDPDAALKCLLDACVACGLLLDDDRKRLEIGSIHYERAARKGLDVVLEDMQSGSDGAVGESY